jgi:putative MFS transporter
MVALEARAERDAGAPLPPAAATGVPDVAGGRSSLRELFTPRYRRRTAMAWMLWFCVLLGYYGITTWIARLLADQGLSVAKSITFVLLMALWGVPGFLCASLLVDRLGRKPTLVACVLLSAAAAFAYGHAASTGELIAAGSVMQFSFFAMWSALYAYTPEIFPTRARASGCGTASGVGRIGAAIGPLVVPGILARGGADLVFELAAGAFCVAAAVVLLLGPETRRRALEEVSA